MSNRTLACTGPVISGQCAGDNERLCAILPHLPLQSSMPQTGLQPGTARSVGQRLTLNVLSYCNFYILLNNISLISG